MSSLIVVPLARQRIGPQLNLTAFGRCALPPSKAEKMKRAEMIKNTKIYWVPWETIYEGNPQQPRASLQKKFAASYRTAGNLGALRRAA
jgi:hypothetical protein